MMRVQDIMTASVRVSQYDSALTAVARLMREESCGLLPAVEIDLRVLQVISGREISLVAAARPDGLASILVGELVLGRFRACSPDDDLRTVLAVMKNARLEKLPVLDRNGVIRGIIAMSDLVRCEEGQIDREERVITSFRRSRSQPAEGAEGAGY